MRLVIRHREVSDLLCLSDGPSLLCVCGRYSCDQWMMEVRQDCVLTYFIDTMYAHLMNSISEFV
jgi:hypothetical protein